MNAKLEWLSEEEGRIVFRKAGEHFMTMQLFFTGEEEAECHIQDVVFPENDSKNNDLCSKVIQEMIKCISCSFRLLWEEGFEETILVEPNYSKVAKILDSTDVVYLAYKEYMMKKDFIRQESTECGSSFLHLTKSEDGYCCENTEGTFF